VPELSVEELLSPEPEKKAPPQDDILQKIDEIAQGTVGKPRADVSQAVEEAQNSPETILQKADAVTESLEKELETKVKEMSSQESEQLKAKQKGNTRKNKKEKAAREKEEVKAASRKEPEAKPEPEPEAVEEKVEAAVEEKVEPAPAERTEPVSQEKAEAAAAPPADVPPAKPNLKEVVESEGMFSGYGQDDEKKSSPNRAAGLFAKIKRAPKKFIIPIAALALVIGLGAVIMIPKMSKDAPAEQATLGANTLAQPVSAAPQGEDTEKPSVDPGEDPNGLDRQAEAGNAEEDPPVSQPEQQPAERPAQKPEEKPEQKPERQSAPPPNPKPAVEDIAETQVTSQLTGETTPRQTDPVPTRPAQKPPQKNEEETGTEGGTGSGSEAAGPPAEKAASEPEQPVNRAPAKARVGDIVSIKQVDTEPELIQQELPRYPTAARGRGVSGTVLLNALISENGDVLQTVVIRKIDSPYGFNQSAERAVKQWKFRPAWKDGVRVKVWKVIPIVFKENMD
jgi:protein TonB